MSSFILHTNDKARGQVLGNCLSFITQLPDTKAWRVEVKAYTRPRTNDANAYLWGACYPLIVQELGFLAEDWHEFYCIEFFGRRETPSGCKPRRTTTTDDRLTRCAVALYGDRWQSALADALCVGDRRVREWVANDRRPPQGIWSDIAMLLDDRRKEIDGLLRELCAITPDDEPCIREWLNCTTASVDKDGDVWIEGPMVGHWLAIDRKAAYVAWREAH